MGTDRPTDRPTDRRTDTAGYRVACTRLKIADHDSSVCCVLQPEMSEENILRGSAISTSQHHSRERGNTNRKKGFARRQTSDARCPEERHPPPLCLSFMGHGGSLADKAHHGIPLIKNCLCSMDLGALTDQYDHFNSIL